MGNINIVAPAFQYKTQSVAYVSVIVNQENFRFFRLQQFRLRFYTVAV
jgi:hypothetical protein